MVTTELKQQIVKEMKLRASNFPSNAKFSVFLGISTAQLSRVMNNGEIDRVLSDANWISIARKIGAQIGNNAELITAKTPVFIAITEQLKQCQDNALSGLLCDIADIGKTHAAKCYVKENRNAIYVDCSQVKTRQKLIRFIAKEFGLTFTGKYHDVYEDLVFYIRSIANPLIILDEAGDLDYPAFLELKALWNATERACGWYMMGADGLKAKIDSNLGRKKVGYAEIFSRFGSRYQKITPEGREATQEFTRLQVSLIAKANGAADAQKIYASTGGSLRRIYTEIQKLKATA